MTQSLRNLPVAAQVILAVVSSLVLIAVIGAIAESNGYHPAPITHRTAGHMGHDSMNVALSNGGHYYDDLAASGVYCGWRGDHVVIAAAFHNSSPLTLKLTITPTYTLTDDSMHGDSESLTVTVKSAQSVRWVGDAGSPEGDPKPGTPIATCSPEITSLDLG